MITRRNPQCFGLLTMGAGSCRAENLVRCIRLLGSFVLEWRDLRHIAWPGLRYTEYSAPESIVIGTRATRLSREQSRRAFRKWGISDPLTSLAGRCQSRSLAPLPCARQGSLGGMSSLKPPRQRSQQIEVQRPPKSTW